MKVSWWLWSLLGLGIILSIGGIIYALVAGYV